HADQRAVAAGVGTDRAHRLLGQVAALRAEADPLLHLADRVGQGERIRFRGLEDMERQPLRGPPANAGQPRELGDQVVDGRGVQGVRYIPGRPRPPRPPSWPIIFCCCSCWAAVMAPFTADTSRSCSISGSSGSIASGLIVMSATSSAPDTFTVTAPPPAECST